MLLSFDSDWFQRAILAWFEIHGRHTLPWQKKISPYRVWVSEIMLQQTQVTTVIDYFNRFMQRFPSIAALADASQDEVLHYWSGLGYYARARHLHHTAKKICEQYGGIFPENIETLETLPGIGRSTAGAIVSLACQKRAVILDGNVKRVLTRLFGIKEWAGERDTLQQLWQLADHLTPQDRVHHYNQAMMDLGATLCTRSNPLCKQCPIKRRCIAYQENLTKDIPAKKPKKDKPIKQTYFLMIQHTSGAVLLQKRPDQGIWGGLWCFPELSAANNVEEYCATTFTCPTRDLQQFAPFRHTFTHYHLDITPLLLKTTRKPRLPNHLWYTAQAIGLAAPTRELLQTLEK